MTFDPQTYASEFKARRARLGIVDASEMRIARAREAALAARRNEREVEAAEEAADELTVAPTALEQAETLEDAISWSTEWARIRAIKEHVARKHGVSVADLESDSRLGVIVAARFEAIGLVNEHTTLSMPGIGRTFGNRDHTTIIHAIRRWRTSQGLDALGRPLAHHTMLSLANLVATYDTIRDGQARTVRQVGEQLTDDPAEIDHMGRYAFHRFHRISAGLGLKLHFGGVGPVTVQLLNPPAVSPPKFGRLYARRLTSPNSQVLS